MIFLAFSFLFAILGRSNGASIPSGITGCKVSDEECMKKAGTAALHLLQEGDKSLGLNQFNALLIQKVHIPGNGGQVDLEQDFEDVTFSGIGSAEITKFKVDLTDGKCMIDMETVNKDNVMFVGKYKLTGKLLLFTLRGSGNAKVTFVKLKIGHALKCEKFKKGNDEYLKITDAKLSLLPGKVIYEFPNVVSGDERLSDEINKVANENDLEIFDEIKEDYAKVFAQLFMGVENQFFAKVPIKELFLS